jgi:hypothetical protein
MLEALLLRFAHLSNTLDLEAMLRGEAPAPPAAAAAIGRTGERTHVRKSAPVPDPQPAPPAAAKPALAPVTTPATAAVEAAWKDLVETRTGIPQGMAIFLKVATISEPEHGQLVLEVPKGPALEKLSTDPNARATVERALASKLGRAVTLDVRAEGTSAQAGPAAAPNTAPAPKRFTPEQVKTDKLARMAKEEPVLGKAVEEWNLELLD